MAEGIRSALKVCLYVAIPEQDQFRAVENSPARRAKSILKHTLNMLATQLTGRLIFDVYHYKIAKDLGDNSNRGDIAIRIAIREQILEAAAPRPVEFTEVCWGELTEASISEIDQTCDLFVIGGGGYVFINGDGSGGARFADVELLARLRCPIVAFGIGLNRLMHEEVLALEALPESTRTQVRALSDVCAAIGVRDRDTLELFNLYGDKRAVLIGDPVLFWRSREIAQRNPAKRPLAIGINLASHGWRAASVLSPLLPDIVTLLKGLEAQYNVELLYLQHHDFEKPVAAYLRQRGIRVTIVERGAAELLVVYDNCDLVICQMLHACIFAANAEVPFLNIAYDRKNIAFCALMGVSDYCIPHAHANLLVLQQRLDELLRDRANVSTTISESKMALLPAHRRFVWNIVKDLGGAQ